MQKKKKNIRTSAFLLALKKDFRIEHFDLTARLHTPKPHITAILCGIIKSLVSSLCAVLNIKCKNSSIDIQPEFENGTNFFELSCIISFTIPNIITAYLKAKKSKE